MEIDERGDHPWSKQLYCCPCSACPHLACACGWCLRSSTIFGGNFLTAMTSCLHFSMDDSSEICTLLVAAHFPSCSLPHSELDSSLVVVTLSSVAEEMLSLLKCFASAPSAFVILLVSESLQVHSRRRMHTHECIEYCCQWFHACQWDGSLAASFTL